MALQELLDRVWAVAFLSGGVTRSGFSCEKQLYCFLTIVSLARLDSQYAHES